MNPGLQHLHPYPFEKLATLFEDTPPGPLAPINLSIGEPQHATPSCILDALTEHLDGIRRYPATRGLPQLREAIAYWLGARYQLESTLIDPDRHVVPVAGTREALFSIAQCLVDGRTDGALVAMPNPFYQIYEGAALLAGAEPYYVPNVPPANENADYLPDLGAVPADTWRRCQLLYLCSPTNPSGEVIPIECYRTALELADQHDFVIVADECYAEIYRQAGPPPLGLLEACARLGRSDFKRCLVMHSLSKRSNAPGLRSGFVAGDATVLAQYLRYRTYQGCALPLHVQHASIAAWADEAHVRANRALYDEKYAAVAPILAQVMACPVPPGSFYLWPEVPGDDAEFARGLLQHANVTVLPGSFLARETNGRNPGSGRIRIALVDHLEACVEAAERIVQFVERHG